MRKRMLSICMMLVMCLSLLPTETFAEDTHTDHCICGAEHEAVGDHTAAEAVTWTGISDLSSITTSGYYYLTTDVTLSESWNPADGTVLCLNGHSITGAKDHNAISVSSGVTLTLTDCKGTGTIKHQTGERGKGVSISGSGTFIMYGGEITGNSTNDGGGVNVGSDATFTMYAGTIGSNSASSGGGGVNVESDAAFAMYGGTVSNNSANYFGGGVNVDNNGTFTMTGGEISGNTANSGGGVYVSETAKFALGQSGTKSKVTINGNTKTGSSDFSNVYLNNNARIEVRGPLNQNSTIGVFTPNDYTGGIFAENSDLTVQTASLFRADVSLDGENDYAYKTSGEPVRSFVLDLTNPDPKLPDNCIWENNVLTLVDGTYITDTVTLPNGATIQVKGTATVGGFVSVAVTS